MADLIRTKVAVLRDPGPVGQSMPLRLGCPCGHREVIPFSATPLRIPCLCGRIYDQRGYVLKDRP